MKHVMLNLWLASGALMLAGCVTWPSTTGYVEVVNQQRIELVEKWAPANNMQVIWLNSTTLGVLLATKAWL
jgi:starvation-inducible outer membrane lipoprotein